MDDSERKPISEFRKLSIRASWPTPEQVEELGLRPNTMIFTNMADDKVVAQVDADDLLDVDGNRFWLDA